MALSRPGWTCTSSPRLTPLLFSEWPNLNVRIEQPDNVLAIELKDKTRALQVLIEGSFLGGRGHWGTAKVKREPRATALVV